jgi:hypothetical protein
MVPALEVFRIAGGDVECEPRPTAESALACLRDLRQCYEERGDEISSLERNRPSEHGGGGEAVATYGVIDPDYARVFTIARCLAWAEGYMLSMHGSFTRDLDLIAVPWAESACDPEHLMRRIEEAAGLRCITDDPGVKPHGRLAWTLKFKTFGDPRFVDLGIIPPPQPRAEGMVLVPREPTPEMKDAGRKATDAWLTAAVPTGEAPDDRSPQEWAWEAMLAAAPGEGSGESTGKTPMGRALSAARERIVASGEPLQPASELMAELGQLRDNTPQPASQSASITPGGVAEVDPADAAKLLHRNGTLDSARAHMHFPSDASQSGKTEPAPNWCRTCGKHWRDPDAMFCSNGIHFQNYSQSAPSDGGGPEPGEPAPPPSTPAQHYLASVNGAASQEWQDGFNEASRLAAPTPEQR